MVQIADNRPSAFDRVLKCPGSRRLSFGAPGWSTKYADEGSAAHDLAARCLEGGYAPLELIGDMVWGGRWEADAVMVHHVSKYVAHCRDLQRRADLYGIEIQLGNMPGLDMPNGGTCDFLAVTGTRLHVCDLKYGAGKYVPVEGNAQFLAYCHGAFHYLPLAIRNSIEHITMWCIQPRYTRAEPCRAWTISVHDYMQWLDNVALPGVAASRAPDAPLVPGDHCIFCPAKPSCVAPLQQLAAQVEAKHG